MKNRLPAEWEVQDGVLLAWPHEETDWAGILQEVEPVFVELVRQIALTEQVVLAVADKSYVDRKLRKADVEMQNVRMYRVASNDTWSRDFGPITIRQGDGSLRLLDFGFNGWGLKFAACHDNLITKRLSLLGAFGKVPVTVPGVVLEGGSIESDGAGTILTTAQCLLNENRNPHMSRLDVEELFRRLLGAEQILWLEHGYLAGDDTDSHIDTLARLCPEDTILYVKCDDPSDEHYPALTAMEKELREFRTRDGESWRLIPLPWPKAAFDSAGNRLPATYANFLIINDAVLVPTYRDPRDNEALHAVAAAFPGRRIVGIDCLPLIQQHGSLHCVTMQLPKGVLP
ncbi:agmatine/peptidylarginine deiminase [Geobacter sp. DSM 9736]|uniref:agmatine deiminase family protein n=1 Tax=Geobacter sp. DSM 9736 TaxID=1277350 RepID=UPI000B502EAB|nr:agmatine deiminase family protein [Geobacter sp. DSM 9736]SNB46154.1 agmatine deiminase [Geobacter sp. DSM 9736]